MRNIMIGIMAVFLGVILTGCPSPEEIASQQRPATGHVDTYNGVPMVKLSVGTRDLRELYNDMDKLPHLTETVAIADHGYYRIPCGWPYDPQYGPYFDGYYVVDVIYNQYQVPLPALDETSVTWGILVGYGNNTALLEEMDFFRRGINFEKDLRQVVPDWFRGNLQLWIVATYPNAEPEYCPLSIRNAGQYCFAKLKNYGKKVWIITVGGVEVDEAMDANGNGLGYFSIPWPLQSGGNNDDNGDPGVIDIVTGSSATEGPSVYMDVLSHNSTTRLFRDLPYDDPEQIGGFFWFPEFPEINGTPLTRAYQGVPVVLPLDPIFGLAPAGATKVAFAPFVFDRDFSNPFVPDWAGDAFTTGFPYWWDAGEWSVMLNGAASGEAIGSHGQGLGYILIPLPNTVTKYTLSAGVASGSGSVTGGGSYNSGSTATVTAIPNSGWIFSHWTGDLSGSNNPATITMSSNRSVQAVFIQSTTTYALSASVASGSGSVTGGGNYASGSTATVTAVPANGYVFSHWLGDLSGSNNPATITMNGNKSVQAVFDAINTEGMLEIRLTRLGNNQIGYWINAPSGYPAYAFSGIGQQSGISRVGLEIYQSTSPFIERQTFAFSGWPTTGTIQLRSGQTVLRFENVANTSSGFGDVTKQIVTLDGVTVPRVADSFGNVAYQVTL